MSLREVDGQQINHQILLKFLDDFLLSYKLLFSKEKFYYFSVKIWIFSLIFIPS